MLVPRGDRDLGVAYQTHPGAWEVILYAIVLKWASLVAQRVKRLPAVRKTWVQSLDWEDPLEDGKAIYSGILAWRLPWSEEPGGL